MFLGNAPQKNHIIFSARFTINLADTLIIYIFAELKNLIYEDY